MNAIHAATACVHTGRAAARQEDRRVADEQRPDELRALGVDLPGQDVSRPQHQRAAGEDQDPRKDEKDGSHPHRRLAPVPRLPVGAE